MTSGPPAPDALERKDRSGRSILLSLALVVPLGLATKVYTGSGAAWVQGSLGGVLYEVFWCLALGLCFRRAPAVRIAGGVLLATSALEFLQLWHPPALQALREGFLGRTLLGETFAWSDFPYYFVGSGLGWAWLRQLGPRQRRPHS